MTELVTKVYEYETESGKKRTITRNYVRKIKETSDEAKRKLPILLRELGEYCTDLNNVKGKTFEKILKEFNNDRGCHLQLHQAYETIKNYNRALKDKEKQKRYKQFQNVKEEYNYETLMNPELENIDDIVEKIKINTGYSAPFIRNCVRIFASAPHI